MTRRSRVYFDRKKNTLVAIPFKHEPSIINDLFMFGRAFVRTEVNEQGTPYFSHMTTEEYVARFNKDIKSVD